ncbi:hypothetical protein N566_07515 [Streptomycetaceae bacterium MP113-05]|nr:hypothetical protein N566_07515 [Streptomycetaceae bacterium MP113-05]
MTAPKEADSGPAVAAWLLEELARRGETVAVAESLTGGLVAGALTAAQGSSRAFRGGIVAYATDIKHGVLGVAGPLLDERGAVDPEVACGMAHGVRRVMHADWGIATTGVAGPDRQDGKPVGLVYVAVAGPGLDADSGEVSTPASGTATSRARASELRFAGGRAAVRKGAVLAALNLLRDEMGGV